VISNEDWRDTNAKRRLNYSNLALYLFWIPGSRNRQQIYFCVLWSKREGASLELRVLG
jgi:hypothetical protein